MKARRKARDKSEDRISARTLTEPDDMQRKGPPTTLSHIGDLLSYLPSTVYRLLRSFLFGVRNTQPLTGASR